MVLAACCYLAGGPNRKTYLLRMFGNFLFFNTLPCCAVCDTGHEAARYFWSPPVPEP